MFGGKRIKELEEEVAKLKSKLARADEDADKNSRVIKEILDVAGLAACGVFSIRVRESASSSELQSVSTAINSMLDSIEEGAHRITEGLVNYAGSNYQHEIQNAGYAGCLGSIMAGILALGSNSSEIFALLTNIGETLRNEATAMTRESEELSSSANEQAANLEETAAAIEEITGNIQLNSQKANDMAKTAEEAKKATAEGAKMADMTAHAMHEIASATQSINEAVAIIENIAFQTNILSLNAAVEAATAGEAGKGFAVVAQEVRNLANRSAEAAKSIKELTDAARAKSGEGLQISQKMNDGFKTIADKIAETAIMVQDVASSSKEQMIGISQINDSITQLDQVTQENAHAAESVSRMSETILEHAETLMQTTSRTKFDPKKADMVSDVEMIFDTTRLKLDHINFKENNYKKIKGANSPFSVTDHNACNLGKWLASHHGELASSTAWSSMSEAHHHVHGKVKELCDNAISASYSPAAIKALGLEVEKDTRAVFDALDEFKIHLGKSRGGFAQGGMLAH